MGFISVSFIGAIFVAGASAQPATAQRRASFTTVQADRGRDAYTSSCADCHGANLDDGEFGGPPLKGAAFRAKWFGFGNSIGTLFAYAVEAMPPDRAGRLPRETYADLVAYLLSVNGITPGDHDLPADLSVLNTLSIAP
jgi:mono/diheme cytochrome c family protein